MLIECTVLLAQLLSTAVLMQSLCTYRHHQGRCLLWYRHRHCRQIFTFCKLLEGKFGRNIELPVISYVLCISYINEYASLAAKH